MSEKSCPKGALLNPSHKSKSPPSFCPSLSLSLSYLVCFRSPAMASDAETKGPSALRNAVGSVLGVFILVLIGVLAFSIRLFSVSSSCSRSLEDALETLDLITNVSLRTGTWLDSGIWIGAYSLRHFFSLDWLAFQVIKYESVIHEFDPYFNYRVTQVRSAWWSFYHFPFVIFLFYQQTELRTGSRFRLCTKPFLFVFYGLDGMFIRQSWYSFKKLTLIFRLTLWMYEAFFFFLSLILFIQSRIDL